MQIQTNCTRKQPQIKLRTDIKHKRLQTSAFSDEQHINLLWKLRKRLPKNKIKITHFMGDTERASS